MEIERRDFLTAVSSGALTTSIFARSIKGANDRINLGFIGMGKMGNGNLEYALKQENVAVSTVCDVYEPNLQLALGITKGQAKAVRDFRVVLADKSIDAVCISTPDHWHAYMTVEACKAGKDVWVEKPICCAVEEGRKMVEAARKYQRVVQAGTMQRSSEHFEQAVEVIKSGRLGKITFVRTWNYSNANPEGLGNPPDSAPPGDLDWDMWLGPAPKRPFNINRFGVHPRRFSSFRWFWDYAGGMMTDWGVHWLDIVQMAFNEVMPNTITAAGTKFILTDNRETPDTLQVTYEYPGFIATYENREGNRNSMFGESGGILFHGDKATMFLNRGHYMIFPEGSSDRSRADAPRVQPEEVKAISTGNINHWKNFLQCIKTRERPQSDIDTCYRSTATCLLGNVALRSKMRLDWDGQTVRQVEARKLLSREYRKPWRLMV